MMASKTIAVNRTTLFFGAVALVAAGAAGAWGLRGEPAQPSPAPGRAQPQSSPAPVSVAAPVTIPLTREAAARAGVETAAVESGVGTATLRIPGVVQPNAYKTVAVTPLARGKVTRVVAELGQAVRHGQLLAEIYSPELAEARTKYLSARAELGAHDLEVQRTEKLVAIGAASRQELEKVHAEHTSAVAMVESYRSQLSLLGLSEQQIQAPSPQSDSATLQITSPANGTITEREVNVGLNVDSSATLFTIADLSEVWVVGDLYERDLQAVAVGASATVTFSAYPDLRLPGRVGYIAPAVKTDTRTAQLRVEVPNRDGQLRLGMLAELHLDDHRAGSVLAIPRTALQTVSDKTVVYVADPENQTRFVERAVSVEPLGSGETVRVLSGLGPGDVVVVKGSFALRAERDRLGLGSAAATSGTAPVAANGAPDVQVVRVSVTPQGFEPARANVSAGRPVRLSVERTTDNTCGKEILIPSLNIRRSLPLNQVVQIDLPSQAAGELAFECGMKMLKGAIVVQ